MPRLLSGRVGLSSASGLTTDRYSFIGLEQVEPNLGNPANNNFVLYSDVNGNRFWAPITPAGTVDGITVEDEGVTPVGFAGSITIMNFVGSGVSVTQTTRVVSGLNIGVATVTVQLPPEQIGIGSVVVGSDPGVVEYLNNEVGLDAIVTIDASTMPNAERAWSIYETLVLNDGDELIIGDGRIFTVDILNLGSL
jgi:hypothetical protein